MTVLWAPEYVRYEQQPFKRVMCPVERPVEEDAGIVTAYRDGTVTLRSRRRMTGYTEAADLSSYQGVSRGDLVVHGLDILAGAVGVSDSDGAMSAVCTVCQPLNGADPRFVAYVIRSQAHHGFTQSMARGIRQRSADFRRWETLADLPIPCPPPEVQRRVADFLDAETARIDTLIDKNSRAMTLAEEAFAHALTDVLAVGDRRPFTPLDGPVPPGYRPLWLAGTTFSGKTLQGEQKSDRESEVPYLKASNVTSRGVDLDTVHTMWASNEEIDTLAVRPGDVLVIEGGATAGRAALLEQPPAQPTILQNHVHCVRPADGFDGGFLYWVLAAYYESDYYDSYTSAVTFASFPSGKLRALPVPDLTLDEQQNVSVRLKERRNDIDAVHARMRQFNDLLKERRQALITAAVTGQLDI